ncbi:hypothetical protein SDC9_110190 [bioreactor metagenome]|uniref:Uncharacterized protein n=1 Tax=bioreactor metagenome TaxID=1076179 RepID=A0A645BCW7_9ZZZZ
MTVLGLVIVLEDLSHRITRAFAHLAVDAADILADDAEREERDAADDELGGLECLFEEELPGADAEEEAAGEHIKEQQKGDHREQHAGHRHELQRHERKARHQVEIEAYQLEESVLGFSKLALAVRDGYLYGVDGELLRERGDEGRRFLTVVDDVDDAPVIAAQHAAVVAYFKLRDAVGELVDELRGDLAEDRVPAADAVRADDVVPLVHLFDDVRYLRGRVLQVGVERDDLAAARVVEARHDRHVLSEIRAEVDHAHLRVKPVKVVKYPHRRVAAAVVDENHLEASPEVLHHGPKLLEELVQRFLLIVGGDDDRDLNRLRRL